MLETDSMETRPSPHRCKTVSSQNDIQNINQLIQQQTDIIVIDNVRSHHAKMVKQILDKSGIRYMYLPPYSPDLNPIEKMWSKLKAYLRKEKVRIASELPAAIERAFSTVRASDCLGKFRSCDYVQ